MAAGRVGVAVLAEDAEVLLDGDAAVERVCEVVPVLVVAGLVIIPELLRVDDVERVCGAVAVRVADVVPRCVVPDAARVVLVTGVSLVLSDLLPGETTCARVLLLVSPVYLDVDEPLLAALADEPEEVTLVEVAPELTFDLLAIARPTPPPE